MYISHPANSPTRNGAQPTIEIESDETLNNPKIFFELALREIIEGNMDLEQVTEE